MNIFEVITRWSRSEPAIYFLLTNKVRKKYSLCIILISVILLFCFWWMSLQDLEACSRLIWYRICFGLAAVQSSCIWRPGNENGTLSIWMKHKRLRQSVCIWQPVLAIHMFVLLQQSVKFFVTQKKYTI